MNNNKPVIYQGVKYGESLRVQFRAVWIFLLPHFHLVCPRFLSSWHKMLYFEKLSQMLAMCCDPD